MPQEVNSLSYNRENLQLYERPKRINDWGGRSEVAYSIGSSYGFEIVIDRSSTHVFHVSETHKRIGTFPLESTNSIEVAVSMAEGRSNRKKATLHEIESAVLRMSGWSQDTRSRIQGLTLSDLWNLSDEVDQILEMKGEWKKVTQSIERFCSFLGVENPLEIRICDSVEALCIYFDTDYVLKSTFGRVF
jgi:hypothetical protein